ncbi:helix-turn-helix domain-containing protein [Desertivirga arenae]|uniref:helix-turn-helix domain-containing protein n=1 Tax=Desertivirga arenae TaxID=2810309 RepID=UPI001A96A2BD|nr:helix-turn-helix domain-containing protein [Pedobacter sp. SYSU D00823]
MEHRGQIIEKIIRTRISISEFSRHLNVSRRTIYNWFKKPDLSFAIIEEIALVLDYDFSEELPELSAKKNTDSKSSRVNALFWKQKYTDLLELHHAFLRDHPNSAPHTRI